MKPKISITVPRSWQELSDRQLYYLYNLFADNLSSAQIKTFCLMKWGKLKVVCRYGDGYIISHGRDEFQVTAELLADAIHALDWIEDFPLTPVRIATIGRNTAVDASFLEVSFDKFMFCDNLYQGYLETQNHQLLDQMATVLYGSEKIRLNKAEKMSVFYWWTTLKMMFARYFPNFFQPMPATTSDNLLADNSIGRKLQEAMNTQIRALTKGDITKEKDVLSMDTWRALTELDAQAKEYEELKNQYGNKS